MDILKMNLLGGAVAYIKDTFNKYRDYTLPYTFQRKLDIDVLAIDTEEELQKIINDDGDWRGFWKVFGEVVAEGLLE